MINVGRDGMSRSASDRALQFRRSTSQSPWSGEAQNTTFALGEIVEVLLGRDRASAIDSSVMMQRFQSPCQLVTVRGRTIMLPASNYRDHVSGTASHAPAV